MVTMGYETLPRAASPPGECLAKVQAVIDCLRIAASEIKAQLDHQVYLALVFT